MSDHNKSDDALAKAALDAQNRMPFFEAAPEVVYAPRVGTAQENE
jgi:hypothetical protein